MQRDDTGCKVPNVQRDDTGCEEPNVQRDDTGCEVPPNVQRNDPTMTAETLPIGGTGCNSTHH